ncbi:bifunctional cytochrome P450/NADPH--P450 reductase [Tengunoibacter tsumagoiensis]|uniref:Bifunctional cytochrome P450/NADPH--P450 reductase n=1 Tax=Tengunoibacter tsumagoiensis TaxID=2014871 RepID=A0A402A324_9CHLR|nr:cytochrome P450 [Tengunoibacter tsumagoiensis]GCE13550.1 NADPH--cytochrome P450 reductase [Tengunoibacter tsumagoiensis]
MATHSVSDHTNRTKRALPQPPAKFLVGNLFDVSGDHVQNFMKLAREYGPIYQLDLPGRQLVVVSGFDLVDELSDETRFDKKVWTPLRNIRSFAGDGLFTAETKETNWRKAHNILLPNFSLKAMQGYFPMMLDIAEQMLGKWERLNPEEEIDVPDNMTRLTLDTIGLCGFDYRFNSFYRENAHPFVNSMVNALGEVMESGERLPIQNKLMVHKQRQLHYDIEYMNTIADQIIQERKKSNQSSAGKKDLLSYMLTGVDKETGEKLDDVNIRYQMITFLIAGHETTSGLLSFATYFLLNNPAVLAKAYEEVDRVLGPDPTVAPTFAQVNRLKYISQILKETLRLWPTAPMFSVYPYEPTTIADTYTVDAARDWAVLIPMLHRDKSIWGEDSERFNPDHFTVEAEQNRPANAYKPFGNGQRACIGRQFAMQEATLVLGMMLQRFKLIDHTNYQLKIKETLTLKPENFFIRVAPRTDADRNLSSFVPKIVTGTEQAPRAERPTSVNQHNTPLLVLFGSNLGSAEDIAHTIAEDGEAYGFAATVAPLDEYTNKLPTDGAVVVVTASYNGTPPDNAEQFCTWVKSPDLAPDAFKGVKFAVFGCGNREWASTFQAIPRLIDSQLEQHGAERIYQRGEGDASDDFDSDFQNWYQPLWQTVAERLEIDLGETSVQTPQYEVELLTGEKPLNPFVASFGAQAMKVVENRELQQTDESGRSTRHIVVALPEGVSYRAGDHLGIIGSNSQALVKRVAARFNFDAESKIRLTQSGTRKTHLPIDQPILVFDLLTDYVELQDVATRSQIKVLADHTECPPDKRKLLALCSDDEPGIARYREEIMGKRKSLIDLLEELPACELPFNVYLQLLSPIRPRYYSISSSPMRGADTCSITVAVVNSPARSGHGTFEGLCSTYLAQQGEGSVIYGYVRDTGSSFRLVEDARTPLIMVGPGTGLAPFRGFLQERATLKAAGKEVGPSLLFFGCRHPQHDYLYEGELKDFEQQGITTVVTAFSRWDGCGKTYVQDNLRQHKDQVWQLLENGGVFYICGDAGAMAPAVRQTLAEIYREQTGSSAEAAEQWLTELTAQQRYLVDVWASN